MAKWMVEGYQREDSPCWEICVIRHQDKLKITTSVAFKIHHALVDGYSCLHILDKLTGQRSPYLVKDHEDKGKWREIKQFVEAPLKIMEGQRSAGQGNVDSATFKVTLPRAPEEGSDRVRCLDWMYSFTSLSLEEMRIIRRRSGGYHMTSVIWAIIGGALRRFLKDKGLEDDKLPELIVVGVTLPVPRHPAMVENKGKDKLCNHWCSSAFKLAIRESDPEVRLRLFEDQLNGWLDNGLDKMMDKVMPCLVWATPPYLMEKTMGSPDFQGGSGYLSSMVGVEEEEGYRLLDCPVRNLHWCLAALDTVPSVPLSCFTFSHGGKMELTMAANPHSIFGGRGILDKICKVFVHEEINELLGATNKVN